MMLTVVAANWAALLLLEKDGRAEEDGETERFLVTLYTVEIREGLLEGAGGMKVDLREVVRQDTKWVKATDV